MNLMMNDLFPAAVQPAAKVQHILKVAAAIADRIVDGSTVDRSDLSALMTGAFGATDASGAWSMRDAYDALEAAQALAIWRIAGPSNSIGTPCGIEDLDAMLKRLPTQTYRSENQIALQQFSTPLTLAAIATAAARLRQDDVVLEPSAGTGMLASWTRLLGARLVLNELDPQRADILSGLYGVPITRHDAEFIDDLLAPDICPTAILINPPFSRSESRGDDAHAGARHLRSALMRLQPGGRCVAIMPAWFSPDRSGASGYAAVAAAVPPRVDMLIGGGTYAKHGTSIDVRIIVYDKGWSGDTRRIAVDGIHAAFEAAGDIPVREALVTVPDLVPKRPSAVIIPRKPASSLFGKLPTARVAAPKPVAVQNIEAQPLGYVVLETPRPAAEPTGIYVPYRLGRIDISGTQPHPTPLVESIAMSSIVPPAPSYRPMLPERAVAALSDAQLETVIYAGDAFARDLPGRFKPNAAATILETADDGAIYRQGYFLGDGDGTGAGKGRQVAAIIFDNWCQGRRRALWVSKTSTLLEDARRDWSALGGLALDIQPLDAFPFGTEISMQSGILFVTYATLRSQRHDQASRLQQILQWLGPDHDGMIVFDEAHAMVNAAGTDTGYGTQKGSEQGLAGVRLQNALPRARILYVSATGATDVANLCYASRLGLWGPGTAFLDRETFMSEMTEGGIAAMELVARDLKAQGLYTARALSFAGVEYDMLEHALTTPQVEIYDAYAGAWEVIHQNLEAALAATNIVDRMNGDSLNSNAKNSALSRFESTKQRFFGQLLISMTLPTLIRAIEKELSADHAVVVQLVTTAEAMLNRRLSELSAEERANLAIELSPREYVVDYLNNAFPTRMMRVYRDEQDNPRSEPMSDEEGRPVHCQEALRARDELVERLCAMPAVGSALDELLRHFGTHQVAEVTGRTKRLVFGPDGQQKLETRSGRSNIGETAAFMDGTKRIIAFSDAGGTGRSYHADKGARSAKYRRIHFLLEPGWRAAEAIQGLGRSNRTNQASAPVFRPVTTNCKGQRRFISTIARRLDSLGALTRGQRQTGGQNLFNPADNLESDYAKEALNQWYHLLHAGKLASVSLDAFVRMTGLRLVDKESGGLLEKLPPIQRWLNRLLALRIVVQDAIFDEYLALIEARVDAAREAGTLDVGVETIAADKMILLDEHVLRRDPATGAETKLTRLELHSRKRATTFARLMQIWEGTDEILFMRNDRSGRVALRVPSYSIMEDDGSTVRMFQLVRPTGAERMRETSLYESHWRRIERDACEAQWHAEVEEASSRIHVETINLATGLLLPVWNKLPDGSVQVWRVTDSDGNALIGRIIPAASIERLTTEFGVAMTISLSLGEIMAAARTRTGIAIPALNGARMMTAMVNGQQRLELRDYPPSRLSWFKSLGCFTEIIAYKTRLFVPTDRAEAIVARLIETNERAIAA